MKKYVAIGHFDGNKNTTSVVMENNTRKEFAADLICNGFRAYAILTEKAFNEMNGMNSLEIYDRVKKLTGNYRKWSEITDYIEQCVDIIEEKLANVQ